MRFCGIYYSAYRNEYGKSNFSRIGVKQVYPIISYCQEIIIHLTFIIIVVESVYMITKITIQRLPNTFANRNRIVKMVGKASVWVGGNPDCAARDYRVGESLNDKQVDSICAAKALYEVTTIM